MKIRYWKILRDLTSDYLKNAMLVLAMALGLFGVGCALGAYAVLNREVARNYQETRPASATIEMEGGISRELVDRVKTLPGITDADRRATLLARMKVHDKWYPILLFVIDDFTRLRISKFTPLSGSRQPLPGTMLVERTALGVMDATEGADILIKTTNGQAQSVQIAGTVHDPSLAPAWQEQAGYGYITLETLRWLGETQAFDQLKIQVADSRSRASITAQAKTVATWLELNGYRIHEIQVPPPNQHPHQSQMQAVMEIMVVFSYLLLILGAILVATSVATLMVKQVRQIGVMKTVGATSRQIAGLYLVMTVVLCGVAFLFSIPLSRYAAWVLSAKTAELLNVVLMDQTIPAWVVLLQLGTGLVIPLLLVSFPVIRASRRSVKTALDHYGVSGSNSGFSSGQMGRMRFGNELLTLSLRNAFRQRARLILSLVLLTAGGAMFMTALNVSEAWFENLSQMYSQRLYDVEIRLNEPLLTNPLIAKLKSVAGVNRIETGSSMAISLDKAGPYAISSTYPDKGHGSFTMQALPIPTRVFRPKVAAGRWLSDPNRREVVLNQGARSQDLKLGDEISLSLAGKPTSWHVVGFTEDVGSPATAYVSLEVFNRLLATPGRGSLLRIGFANRSQEAVFPKIREIEQRLERENTVVRASIPVWIVRNAIAAHLRMLVNTLIAMAVLMALVGGIGLLSTLSMNVLERTREIGIMRAIGATPQKIKSLIVLEGLAIGLFSLVPGFLGSLALSTYLGRFIGNLAFRTPLQLVLSQKGLVIWFTILVTGSILATLYPAHRANRLTTHEALGYE
ncbi:ABC transporter permease [Larkinella rosea]|uniref:FtsX-like permease family protein n=1 Tax=Larkinella rosea TaxID=2025312 RepID=A0A3P1BV01_9BACT|nr:FtsX-like permease family protein [Larkinella rosea]RRB04930.1 FtsX-like permease family protein [Larkinella rosea]